MKNSMNIVSATAGLAKIAKEHNASKLADDYRISLGFDYDKQKADKARILGCTTSSCNSLINVTKTLNNSKAVTAMKNSMNIVSATAGLAKIAKEHNASKLADDYRISLGFDYDKQKADKARILGCTTSSCNSLINVTKTLNNSKAVNHSPCYTVTYSLHSVNSVKLYIYFSSST